MGELKPPIIVIGGTRSGTTMLARALGEAPSLCLWHEPNVIWRIGAAYRPDDRVPASNARPWVRGRLKKLFLEYQERHGGARIVEKTPQNVLRIPFIHAVFPEAKFIHIYRDGRANLRSQVEQFETFNTYNLQTRGARHHVIERLKITPWWEWPAYLPRVVSGISARLLKRKRHTWWGLRYPGWKRDHSRLTPAQIAARQWVIAVEQAFDDLEQVPDDQRIHLKYEDVTRDPRSHIQRILEFCNETTDEDYLRNIEQTVHPKSVDRWREELDPSALEEAMPILEPTLNRLGYVDA